VSNYRIQYNIIKKEYERNMGKKEEMRILDVRIVLAVKDGYISESY
jgi:hypothetical protein